MSSPNPSAHQQRKQPSPIPVSQFRAVSRNNSNTSTASSSNRGEFSSTLSTTNSVASSHLSRPHQLIDHRQFLASCGSTSTPIRSFQRATISSVVKTRAFDNNPVLQGLLVAPPSGQNSVSNSQASSPLSTPVFSRSRSLRMSGGPGRYQQSPSHYLRTSSRTPELYSFNHSGDTSGYNNDSQAKLQELNSERSELKESLEFLECERQVLIDSANETKETLQKERAAWKKELDELKMKLTDTIAARVRAESQLTKVDMETDDNWTQVKNLTQELQSKDKQLEALQRSLEDAQSESRELKAMNEELKRMIAEKLKFNGLLETAQSDAKATSDCISIVTEMARLRIELNEKSKLVERLDGSDQNGVSQLVEQPRCKSDVESLNKFLDETVECIKGWPEELASSSHVQNLMKTLLGAYKPDNDEVTLKFQNIHL